jgi:hypothetical protein
LLHKTLLQHFSLYIEKTATSGDTVANHTHVQKIDHFLLLSRRMMSKVKSEVDVFGMSVEDLDFLDQVVHNLQKLLDIGFFHVSVGALALILTHHFPLSWNICFAVCCCPSHCIFSSAATGASRFTIVFFNKPCEVQSETSGCALFFLLRELF